MSICDNQFTSNCDDCYEVSRADNDLVFVYGLTALTQYYLWVIDKFNNSYRVLFTSGADGSFTIDPTNSTYPSGMFNKFAGDFEVFISSDSDGANIVPLTVYATEYNCVILTITSSSQINCTTPTTPGCDPAYITDGVNAVEVPSGESYVCGTATTFNMIVNQNGVEIYNQVWDAISTNEINLTLN